MACRVMADYRVLVSDPISDKGIEALASHPDIAVDAVVPRLYSRINAKSRKLMT